MTEYTGAKRYRLMKRFCLGVLAGVLLIVAGCGHGSTMPTPASATHTKHEPQRLSKNYIYGRIIEINGGKWKVNAIHGHIYTAHVTNVTMYGDLFKPQHRNDFKIGDDVRIAGVFVGADVTATAVEHAVDKH